MKVRMTAIGIVLSAMFAKAAKEDTNTTTFKLDEATIASIHTAILNKQVTSEQLVRMYLERIKAYNRAIESEAAAVDARLLNLFIQPVREDLVFDLDGFHPNEAGHRELARLFLDLIFPLVKAR